MDRDPQVLQRQIDALIAQGVRNHEGIADLERRADGLEVRAGIDREMIIDLQAEGLLHAEHAEHLELALKSSRTIGAAIGLLMGSRNLDQGQSVCGAEAAEPGQQPEDARVGSGAGAGRESPGVWAVIGPA